MKTVYVLAYQDYDGAEILNPFYTNRQLAEKVLIEANIKQHKRMPLYEIWEYDLNED